MDSLSRALDGLADDDAPRTNWTYVAEQLGRVMASALNAGLIADPVACMMRFHAQAGPTNEPEIQLLEEMKSKTATEEKGGAT